MKGRIHSAMRSGLLTNFSITSSRPSVAPSVPGRGTHRWTAKFNQESASAWMKLLSDLLAFAYDLRDEPENASDLAVNLDVLHTFLCAPGIKHVITSSSLSALFHRACLQSVYCVAADIFTIAADSTNTTSADSTSTGVRSADTNASDSPSISEDESLDEVVVYESGDTLGAPVFRYFRLLTELFPATSAMMRFLRKTKKAPQAFVVVPADRSRAAYESASGARAAILTELKARVRSDPRSDDDAHQWQCAWLDEKCVLPAVGNARPFRVHAEAGVMALLKLLETSSGHDGIPDEVRTSLTEVRVTQPLRSSVPRALTVIIDIARQASVRSGSARNAVTCAMSSEDACSEKVSIDALVSELF